MRDFCLKLSKYLCKSSPAGSRGRFKYEVKWRSGIGQGEEGSKACEEGLGMRAWPLII